MEPITMKAINPRVKRCRKLKMLGWKGGWGNSHPSSLLFGCGEVLSGSLERKLPEAVKGNRHSSANSAVPAVPHS